jgi:tetratricopeptide (TPR) repeat protein
MFNGSLLRITFLAGLMLFVLTGAVLTVFYLIDRNSTRTTRQQDTFYRILREYDLSSDILAGTEREFEHLNRELDRLERRAIGVESWLSVLKRRRVLANIHPPSRENLNNSIRQALAAYPSSQPLVAFAAAALVKDTAINKENEEQLRKWLELLTDPAFNSLRLALHVLLGDFGSPQKAMLLPANLTSDGSELISVNFAIIKTLRHDYRGAAADIQTILGSRENAQNNSIRFAAEFFYDFGDLRRSAELFSHIDDEKALSRQADALFLAGYTGTARNIWTILSDYQNKNSLYNLAVTATDNEEAASFLERLVRIIQEGNPANLNISDEFGIVRYSRLLDHSQAIAVLQNSLDLNRQPGFLPYVDLEIRRRQIPSQEARRQIADGWLLLDRHLENEDLYEWVTWLFFFQRNFAEAAILLNRMENYQFTQQWTQIYRALFKMQEGDIQAAENIFLSIPAETADWLVYANLGRLYESLRSISRALEYYETAAAMARNPKTTSRLLHRAARCYLALGRSSDAFRSLLLAVEFDPENLAARLELDRIL